MEKRGRKRRERKRNCREMAKTKPIWRRYVPIFFSAAIRRKRWNEGQNNCNFTPRKKSCRKILGFLKHMQPPTIIFPSTSSSFPSSPLSSSSFHPSSSLSDNILGLPKEVFQHILSFLGEESWLPVLLTCKRWRDVGMCS